MAFEEGLRSITLRADASIGIYTGVPGMPGSLSPNSGKQFRWVKVTGTRRCGLCTLAAHEIELGVLQNKPQEEGSDAAVGVRGVSMAESGGAYVAGVALKIDATSRLVAAANGDHFVAVSLDASTEAGVLTSVFIKSGTL